MFRNPKSVLHSISLVLCLCLVHWKSKGDALQVAIIGTTGKLARRTIELLSQQGISCKCLLRHPLTITTSNHTEAAKSFSTSSDVASYLSTLPNVQMVPGDVQNTTSLQNLLQGCDAVLSLQGPSRPNPLKSIFPFLTSTKDPNHGYMVNYIGTQQLIHAIQTTKTVKRIVRITGNNEYPFNIFAIVINMLGYMAKGWNYESEALLRSSGLDYTIIRPGKLVDDDEIGKMNKGLKDNGGVMKITKVSYFQIAQLIQKCLEYDNCKKSTLTVMNLEDKKDDEMNTNSIGGIEDYSTLLALVKPDSRDFPSTLIERHKWGARLGFSILMLTLIGMFKAFTMILAFASR